MSFVVPTSLTTEIDIDEDIGPLEFKKFLKL